MGIVMTVLQFLNECYFLEKDIRRETKIFILMKVGIFAQWLGREPLLSDITADTINRFVVHRLESRARETVRGERATLRAIWQQAYDSSYRDDPPGRIRRLKRLLPVTEAWDHDQIRSLLTECDKLEGRVRKWLIQRRDYWRAVVLVLYSTGLRSGDLMSLKWSDVSGPGAITIIQRKTAKQVRTPITEQAWEALQRIRKPDRATIFGIIGRRSFHVGFKKICIAAGLTGRCKMLRRTHGSMIERAFPGEGNLNLGNGRDVFLRHYRADRIASPEVREPPPIE